MKYDSSQTLGSQQLAGAVVTARGSGLRHAAGAPATGLVGAVAFGYAAARYTARRPSQTSIHSSSESLRPAERMSASSWKYSSRGGRGAGVGLSLTLSAGPAASRSVHVNLDAWSVDTTSTGQVELTLRELRDQALLERTLADAGVPAIVNFGKFCEPVNQADNLTATTGTHFIELPVGRHGDLVAIVGVEDFGAGHGYFVDKIVKDGAPLSCHPIQRVKVKKPAIAAVGG